MATTGRPDEPATPASDVATSCRDAGLIGLVAAPRGEALSALGLLGRALAAVDVPFQARVPPWGVPADLGATDADCTIGICRSDLHADHAIEATGTDGLAARAYEVATALGDADPILGLTAAVAAGEDPGGAVHEDPRAAGVQRRPGVAVPTADLADGLAHSTLVHAPFSGDRSAAADALAGLDVPTDAPEGEPGVGDEDRQRVASLVALAVAEGETCPPQATRAVERVLHPYAGGPLETVGGYAGVLDALARTDPGLGVAIALGRADATAGLDAWRDHASRVHRLVATADRRRHDGLVVVHADDPGQTTDATTEAVEAAGAIDTATMEPVARLVRDYRSPEPTVLCRGPDAVVLATVAEDVDAVAVLGDALGDAAGVDGETPVAGDAAVASATAPADQDATVEAVRRALR